MATSVIYGQPVDVLALSVGGGAIDVILFVGWVERSETHRRRSSKVTSLDDVAFTGEFAALRRRCPNQRWVSLRSTNPTALRIDDWRRHRWQRLSSMINR